MFREFSSIWEIQVKTPTVTRPFLIIMKINRWAASGEQP